MIRPSDSKGPGTQFQEIRGEKGSPVGELGTIISVVFSAYDIVIKLLINSLHCCDGFVGYNCVWSGLVSHGYVIL